MDEKGIINTLIDSYVTLQTIKAADDVNAELDYQIDVLKAKMESMGIATTRLERKKKN